MKQKPLQKTIRCCAVLAAAVSLFGCSDDSSSGILKPIINGSEDLTCDTEGAAVCADGGERMICRNGNYELSECGSSEVCVDGKCAEKCDNTTFKPSCDGDGARRVCSGGRIVIEKCTAGQSCDGGTCKDTSADKTCDAASFVPSCDGDIAKTCIDGKEETKTCSAGKCSAGKCLDDMPETCEAASFVPSCDGDIAKTCIDGKVETKTCSAGKCSAGKCLEDTLETCEAASFVPSCDGDIAKTCIDGKVETKTCSAGKCSAGKCLDDMPETCDPEDWVPVCAGRISRTVCDKSGNKIEEKCPDSKICSGGECIDEEVGKCDSATWISECADSTSRTVCDESGNRGIEKCPNTQVCSEGKCGTPAVGPACTDGTPASCDGNVKVACEGGFEVRTECGLSAFCAEGECRKKAIEGAECGDDFYKQCLSLTVSATCSDGRIVSVPCGPGSECHDGICAIPKCDGSYIPECRGDFNVTACEDGKVVEKACGDDRHCSGGICKDNSAEGEECNVETFKNICTAAAGTFAYCDEGKVKTKICDGSKPVCMNGQCAECDPTSYKSRCAGKNLVMSCSSSGSLVTNSCGDTAGCIDGKCTSCDPISFTPTCSGDSTVTCDVSGNIVTSECPEDYHCTNGKCTNECDAAHPCAEHYQCNPLGKCEPVIECDVASSKPVCTSSKEVRKCVGDGWYSNETCGVGEECKNGICTNCNPDTYGYKCTDDTTVSTCVGGKIQKMPCPESAPACYEGACLSCTGTDAAPSCASASMQKVCIKNEYRLTACSSEQTCVEGKGCISKCGEDYKGPYCDDKGNSVTCFGGRLQTETCKFYAKCNDGHCESDVDKACDASFVTQCLTSDDGRAVIKECNENVIQYKYCADGQVCGMRGGSNQCYLPCTASQCVKSGTDVILETCADGAVDRRLICPNSNFCGSIDGQVDCYMNCGNVGDATCLTVKSSGIAEEAYMAVCKEGTDYRGVTSKGFVRQNSICAGGTATSCSLNAEKVSSYQYLDCSLVGGGTCSASTNTCSSLPKCSAKGGACNGTRAVNCLMDPGVGSLVQTAEDCSKYGAACKVYQDESNTNRAICEGSAVSTIDGKKYTITTHGLCLDSKTLARAYYMSGSNFALRTQTCSGSCKTTASDYAYCGN